ncbi:MAG TPA: ATP-binding protein [Nitrospirales bacterium]|nr:ATP-binding protein [Nitrospirales bacterium]
MELLHQHTILLLSVLFGLCLIVIYLHISQLKSQMVTVMAFRGSEIYTRALNEMRIWYTVEVVQRLHAQGIEASEGYRDHQGEIPLPATLSRDLGRRLVAGRPGEQLKLMSPYPFQNRVKSGGLMDSFQGEAWEFFAQHPDSDEPFYRFEQVDGRESLRFAKADRMQKECVECHNRHPDSPKRDWQIGQVGGLLEVVYPINSVETIMGMSWLGTYGLMGMLVVIWMGGFWLVVLKLGRVASELEEEVRDRTGALQSVNKHLELEIHDRQLAEDTLRQAKDNLEKRVQERTGKLAASNAELIREVAERKRAEEDIRKLNSQLVQRSAQLEASNKELEAFSYSVSHDLRAPLRGIDGFSQAVLEDYDEKLDESGRSYLRRVRTASQRMSQLIDAMLNLARLTRAEIHTQTFDMSAVVRGILDDLQKVEPDRQVECIVANDVFATADPQLLRAVLENLLGNAWKFTQQQAHPRIEFGYGQYKGQAAYFVTDNGAGFDMTYVHKLFGAFQRLHAYTEYPGVGVGLATVHRIIQRHGGQIWAEGVVGKGATFHFTL